MVHMHIEENMVTDSKSNKPKWDGKSRVSNDTYRKNYDKIFKKAFIGKDTTLEDVKKYIEEITNEK